MEEGIAVDPRQIRPEISTGINVVLIKEGGEELLKITSTYDAIYQRKQ